MPTPKSETRKLMEKAIEVMKEKNIDISQQKSKGFKDLGINKFDYTVTMGCEDVCPFIPAKQYIEWQIEDPKGKSIETVRQIRDKIEKKVLELINRVKQETN